MREEPRSHQGAKDRKLTVIEDGLHSIDWTHPEQVTKEILDFFLTNDRVLRPSRAPLSEEGNH